MSMRDAFFGKLYEIALKDKDIIILSDDFGAPALEKFKQLPGQFMNMGIAEQNIISVASGLALSGKKVFVYGIAPFITLRCFEQIKIDLCAMGAPVTIVAVGAGYGYGNAGMTHHAIDDIALMNTLYRMNIYSPSDDIAAGAMAKITYQNTEPCYLRLDREGQTPLYGDAEQFNEGVVELKQGKNLTIMSTGIMVNRALQVSTLLENYGIKAGVLDIYRIRPLNLKIILESIKQTGRAVTIEEHVCAGGIGSIINDLILDQDLNVKTRVFAIPRFYFKGDRNALLLHSGLGVIDMMGNIKRWLERCK